MSQPEDPQHRHRMNATVLVAVLLFVAVTVFLMLKLHQGLHAQDCEMAGHKDCVPIDGDR